MKPFDREAALRGEPVVTRDGRKVTQLALFNLSPARSVLYGVIDDFLSSWDVKGNYLNSEKCGKDLFMAPRTILCNGFEVPAPESAEPYKGYSYCNPAPAASAWVEWSVWTGSNRDAYRLERGLVYLNGGDGIKRAKAMSGIDPYKEDV